jgi:hypothetical protein
VSYQDTAAEIRLAVQRMSLLTWPKQAPRVSVVSIAEFLLKQNIEEASNKNDGIPQYLFGDGEALPWCASFVDFCYKMAGYPLPGNHFSNRSVKNLLHEVMEVNCFSRSTCDLGDIVFFTGRMNSDPLDTSGIHHCGVCSDNTLNAITVIEGNCGNTIRKNVYARNNKAIYGFGRLLR